MPVKPLRAPGTPGPFSGDERYWFHLLPWESIPSLDARPEQQALLAHPLVPVPMDLFHSWLVGLLRWIPTVAGDWAALPDSRVFVDATGAATAQRVFQALGDLFSAGPPLVELPGLRVKLSSPGQRTEAFRELAYPRQELVAAFGQLAGFAEALGRGTHLLFCSYWVERPE